MRSKEIISIVTLKTEFPEGDYIDAKTIQEWLIGNKLPSEIMAQHAVIQDVMREWALEGDELAWSPTGWKVKVTGSLVHASLISAITWATLSAIGIATSTIPVAIVPMVAPYLFQIEKVELTRKEEEILTNLPLQDSILRESPDNIYNSLPVEIRNQINQLDFLDFLNKLTEVGQAEEMSDGKFYIRKLGDNTISIKWS